MNKISNKKAVHIYLSTFEHESRILKQTKSLIKNSVVDSICIVARWRPGLPETEELSKGIQVRRLKLLQLNSLGKLAKYARSLISQRIKSPSDNSEMIASQNSVSVEKKSTTSIRDLVYYIIKKIYDSIHAFQICVLIIKDKPDYLNIHHVDLLYLVHLKKLIRHMKVIYDTHELETETQSSVGLLRKKRKSLERRLIGKVDYTFVVTPSIEAWYRSEYGIERISTVRNVPFFQNVSKSRKNYFREKYNLNIDDRIFLYQGALFKGRGLEYLLKSFAKINDRKYSIVFMGYGELCEEIEKYANTYPNIFLHDPVSPESLLDYTVAADVGIALTENVCLSYYYGLGNKIFEYTMAELPLLVSNMLDMSNYVSKYQIGVVAKSFDLDDIVTSVKSFSELDSNEIAANIKRAKNENNWEIESKIMINAYKEHLI